MDRYTKTLESILDSLFPNKQFRLFGIMAILISGILVLLYSIFQWSDWVLYIAIPLFIVGIALTGYNPTFSNILDVSSKILAVSLKEAQERAEREPERSKLAWDLAKIRLEAYFDRNLKQINAIFYLCIFVLLVGFGFILYGIWLGYKVPGTYTPAIVGSAAGVITEFIGATFLIIYKSTIEQAIKYLSTLERINSVGMAMQILDTINPQDSPPMRQKVVEARIEIAKLLLTRNIGEASEKTGE